MNGFYRLFQTSAAVSLRGGHGGIDIMFLYKYLYILTVAQCTGVFAVLAFLQHPQRLEQVDVLREGCWGRGYLHVGGPFRYALSVSPVARLALRVKTKFVSRSCESHELTFT